MAGSWRVEGRVPRFVFVLGGVFVLVVLGLLTRTWLYDGVVSPSPPEADDPNNFRLDYVRPDYGDDIYDAAGKLIGQLPTKTMQSQWWKNELFRQFVFSCRAEGEYPLFLPYAKYSWNKRTSGLTVALKHIGSTGSWYTFSCEPRLLKNISQGYHRFGPIKFRKSPEPLRTIDFEMSYFAGPRGSARATFTGSFQPGCTYRAEEDEKIAMKLDFPAQPSTELRITGLSPYRQEDQLILYLCDGRRLLGRNLGYPKHSKGVIVWTLQYLGKDLGSITHITLGETPHRQAFRNIVVTYPDRPERTYPQSIDEVVARLGLEIDMTDPNEIGKLCANWDIITTVPEALGILDIAQGFFLNRAKGTLEGTRASDLSASQREHLESILLSWLGTDREVEACQLGLWAKSPRVMESIPTLLQSGDLSRDPLRYLALRWAGSARRDPNMIEAVTDFLIRVDVPSETVFEDLMKAVCEHPGEDGLYLKRLAECDKPWIWEPLLKRDGPFERWKKNRQFSRIIATRLVALGMDNWVENPESLKDDAADVLCSMLRPEYIDRRDAKHWCEQFVKQVGPERGTEVLVRFLHSQLKRSYTHRTTWHHARPFWAVGQIVRMLNRGHGLNLGRLEDQTAHFYPDWRDVIREALYWSRTGCDPRMLPFDWRPCADDLRIMWYNPNNPELSMIALWPTTLDPNIPITDRMLETAGDYLGFTIYRSACSAESDPTYDFIVRAGSERKDSNRRALTFSARQLPLEFDLRPIDGSEDKKVNWKGPWKIWVESATAPNSVLDGTNVLRAWQGQHLSGSPGVFRTALDVSSEERLQIFLDGLDYTGMSQADIALYKTIASDPGPLNPRSARFQQSLSSRNAVAKYRKLLQREDLSTEARIFALSRIVNLTELVHRPYYGRISGDEPDALERAISVDPNLISPLILFLRSERVRAVRRSEDRNERALDHYEWLLTRTPVMVEDSSRRPKINYSLSDPQSLYSYVPEESIEQEQGKLAVKLSFAIGDTRRMINYRGSSNPLSDEQRERWERLQAIDKEHWSHKYRDASRIVTR